MKHCICWICRFPQAITIRVAQAVAERSGRTVFIISDEPFTGKVRAVEIRHIADETCIQSHFYGSNYLIPKNVSGWDKCIYFFSRICLEYDFVWILEDDVFFERPDELMELIEQCEHDDADLIATFVEPYARNEHWHHWETALPFVPAARRMLDFVLRVLPKTLRTSERFTRWRRNLLFKDCYKSFNPLSRVSRRLFSEISSFVDSRRTLAFIETLFVNLAQQRKWKCRNIRGMDGIRYRPDYREGEIRHKVVGTFRIFHPVKNFSLQQALWEAGRPDPGSHGAVPAHSDRRNTPAEEDRQPER